MPLPPSAPLCASFQPAAGSYTYQHLDLIGLHAPASAIGPSWWLQPVRACCDDSRSHNARCQSHSCRPDSLRLQHRRKRRQQHLLSTALGQLLLLVRLGSPVSLALGVDCPVAALLQLAVYPLQLRVSLVTFMTDLAAAGPRADSPVSACLALACVCVFLYSHRIINSSALFWYRQQHGMLSRCA